MQADLAMELERQQLRDIMSCLLSNPHAPSQVPSFGTCPQAPIEILYGTALYSGVPVVVWMRDLSASSISFIAGDPLPVATRFVACLPANNDEHVEIKCVVKARDSLGTKLFRIDARFESVVPPTKHIRTARAPRPAADTPAPSS